MIWPTKHSNGLKRRSVLSVLLLCAVAGMAKARIIFGGQPFARIPTPPPTPVDPTAAWQFFTADEAHAIDAIVDRLIPSDALGLGAKAAGCTVFIDRQLAGSYGQSAIWYLDGPAATGTPEQGPQSTNTIAERYRTSLAAFDRFCRQTYAGQPFAHLTADEQDAILHRLESGEIALTAADGKAFFHQVLKNTREGYFADPLYGGNKDMAGWQLVGFPGARYDYRDYIGRPNEALGLSPVSMLPPSTAPGEG